MSEIDRQLNELAAIAVDGIDPAELAKVAPLLSRMREQVAAENGRSPMPPPPDDKLEEVA